MNQMKKLSKAICKVEYESLRADNMFRRHEAGYQLFEKWRMGSKSYRNHEVSKILKVTPEALAMQRARLNKKLAHLADDQKDGEIGRQIKKQQKKNMKKALKQIERSMDLEKVLPQPTFKPKSPGEYSLEDHIQEELLRVGGPETDDWLEIMLHISKYVFINEFSDYRQTISKGRAAKGPHDFKIYMDIANKKAGKLRDMISDNLTQWGTLHTQSVVESMDVQSEKIRMMAEMVIKVAPELMNEVVVMLDGDEVEVNDIEADIMSEVEE